MLRPTHSGFALMAWFRQFIPHFVPGGCFQSMTRESLPYFLFTLNYLPLQPDYISMAHLHYGLVQPVVPVDEVYEVLNTERSSTTSRALRFGFLSGDFFRHASASFLLPLLRHRNRDQLHVTLFRCGGVPPDEYTHQFRELADVWLDVGTPDAATLAAKISAAELDILIDLAGHSANNRLDVMARHAAPLQGTWLGYPNTTGLRDVHYRLTDEIADPYETSQIFAERLVRMSGPFLCYELPLDAPPVSPVPARGGGYVTFGCLSNHNLSKINNVVLECWTRILKAVPNSRLLLKAKQFQYPGSTNSYLGVLEGYGIQASRVKLVPICANVAEHLALYAQVDIALDPFPYNGTTTTCEALCMGVPVVVLRGKHTHVERVGTSLLLHAGLEVFLADDIDDYVELAKDLAGDLDQLVTYRATLRNHVQKSALCDGPDFAHTFLHTWRSLFERWREGDGSIPMPEYIDVME